MRLLIFVSLICLSIGDFVSVTETNWTVSPVIVGSAYTYSDETWVLMDVNLNPVILSENQSASNQSATLPGLSISTYTIQQKTFNNITLSPNTGDNGSAYFINFPSPYTISPTGNMVAFLVLQDKKGINQLFYQYNDLRVDKNTQSGFKSFITDLFDAVVNIVEDVVLVATAVIQDILTITINVDQVPSNLQNCAESVSGIAQNLEDTHSNVKANKPGAAVQSLLGTASSLPSLFSSCIGENLVVPDILQNDSQCGIDLVSIAGQIVDLAENPESFIMDALSIGSLLLSIPSTISTCTGGFGVDSSSSISLNNGSGFITTNTVNTPLYVLGDLRTSDYLGVIYLSGDSSLRIIGIHLDTSTPIPANLTDNLYMRESYSCSTGAALASNSLYCVWEEGTATTNNTTFLIKGSIVDLTTGLLSGTSVLVQSTIFFYDIAAFVTSKSYGVAYRYGNGDYQLYGISNLNSSAFTIGQPMSSNEIFILGTINDANLHIFWFFQDYSNGYSSVYYEQYDGGNFTLVADKGEIISYDFDTIEFNILGNGNGLYGFYGYQNSFYLGLIVFSPVGLATCLILMTHIIMSIFLL